MMLKVVLGLAVLRMASAEMCKQFSDLSGCMMAHRSAGSPSCAWCFQNALRATECVDWNPCTNTTSPDCPNRNFRPDYAHTCSEYKSQLLLSVIFSVIFGVAAGLCALIPFCNRARALRRSGVGYRSRHVAAPLVCLAALALTIAALLIKPTTAYAAYLPLLAEILLALMLQAIIFVASCVIDVRQRVRRLRARDVSTCRIIGDVSLTALVFACTMFVTGWFGRGLCEKDPSSQRMLMLGALLMLWLELPVGMRFCSSDVERSYAFHAKNWTWFVVAAGLTMMSVVDRLRLGSGHEQIWIAAAQVTLAAWIYLWPAVWSLWYCTMPVWLALAGSFVVLSVRDSRGEWDIPVLRWDLGFFGSVLIPMALAAGRLPFFDDAAPGPAGVVENRGHVPINDEHDNSEDLGGVYLRIDDLPTTVISQSSPASWGQTACVVCLSDYCDGDVVKTLPCFHVYHADCIDRWFQRQRTCPVCKQAF